MPQAMRADRAKRTTGLRFAWMRPELAVWLFWAVQMQALRALVPAMRTISAMQSLEAQAMHSTVGTMSAVLASASEAWTPVAACSQGLWQLWVLAVAPPPPFAAE
jgi:hypothetical protein